MHRNLISILDTLNAAFVRTTLREQYGLPFVATLDGTGDLKITFLGLLVWDRELDGIEPELEAITNRVRTILADLNDARLRF